MSRFLFVVPPVAERVRPTVLVARELARRGHDVAWAGRSDGLDVVPAGATDPADVTAARLVGSLRTPSDLILLWNDFLLPLARAMLPTVHAAVDRFGPDMVVADQQALAGAAVAQLSRLPWATIVPTSAGLTDALWDLPKIKRLVGRGIRRFLREAGLDDHAVVGIDPHASPQLVIACTTKRLAGPGQCSSRRVEFVGACLDPRPLDPGIDRHRLDLSRPLVVVALETPHAQRRAKLHRAAIEALSSMEVQAVIVGPLGVVAQAPPGILVMPHARLADLAQHAAVVVCDGGHRTVCEALSNAVPLVVVPLTGDQPIVADQVVRAAAGVRVPARSADAAHLRRALESVVGDVRLRRGAHRARESLVAAPGAPAAADHLESLLNPEATRGPRTGRASRR